MFSSETTGLIPTKLWWNGPWIAPFQNCVRWGIIISIQKWYSFININVKSASGVLFCSQATGSRQGSYVKLSSAVAAISVKHMKIQGKQLYAFMQCTCIDINMAELRESGESMQFLKVIEHDNARLTWVNLGECSPLNGSNVS
jgi:hypothetical protein